WLADARGGAGAARKAGAVGATHLGPGDLAHAEQAVVAARALADEVLVDHTVAIVVEVVAHLGLDRALDDRGHRELDAAPVRPVEALVDARDVDRAAGVRDRFDLRVAGRDAEADRLGLDAILLAADDGRQQRGRAALRRAVAGLGAVGQQDHHVRPALA